MGKFCDPSIPNWSFSCNLSNKSLFMPICGHFYYYLLLWFNRD